MNEDFNKVLDCFTAYDGGISLVNLKVLVENDKTGIADDIFKKMALLIKVANGEISE